MNKPFICYGSEAHDLWVVYAEDVDDARQNIPVDSDGDEYSIVELPKETTDLTKILGTREDG